MKTNKLTITINKPVSEVFLFTTNPENTHKWVDSIVKEQTNEWPVKQGTIYRNQGKDGKWSEYLVSEFKPDEMFVFSKRDSSYHVRYTFNAKESNETELEYHEWMDNGELDGPFTLSNMQKLKTIMER